MLEKSNVPKISVLIPVYNVEKYVERCITSVLNQTMQEGVEVIIVNDCTPDRSMEIIRETLCVHLKKNGMTVRIVEHKINRGSAAVRNTAMDYATGDYIIHIDSDDYVEPDLLEKMYSKAVERGSDIVIIKPRIKPIIIIKPNFFVRSILPPTCSPIGVMDNSAPMEKKIIPRITSTDPTRNSTRMPGDNAATVKPSIKTISTMGITALMDSLAFSLAFSFKTN